MMAAPVLSTAMMAVPYVMAASVLTAVLFMLSRGGNRGCYDECRRKS
jgi:hypothetical protein